MGCYYEITELTEDTKIHKNLKIKEKTMGEWNIITISYLQVRDCQQQDWF